MASRIFPANVTGLKGEIMKMEYIATIWSATVSLIVSFVVNFIAPWCNSSTRDFESRSASANLAGAATLDVN